MSGINENLPQPHNNLLVVQKVHQDDVAFASPDVVGQSSASDAPLHGAEHNHPRAFQRRPGAQERKETLQAACRCHRVHQRAQLAGYLTKLPEQNYMDYTFDRQLVPPKWNRKDNV